MILIWSALYWRVVLIYPLWRELNLRLYFSQSMQGLAWYKFCHQKVCGRLCADVCVPSSLLTCLHRVHQLHIYPPSLLLLCPPLNTSAEQRLPRNRLYAAESGTVMYLCWGRMSAWKFNLVSVLCSTDYLNSHLSSNSCISWTKLTWLFQSVFSTDFLPCFQHPL